MLVFDDSFEHEVWWNAWNSTGNTSKAAQQKEEKEENTPTSNEKERVILIIDIFHPGLSETKKGEIRRQWRDSS